jgi:hypothetical protein
VSDKQDPKDVEKKQQEETKASDELAAKELDQVVGGGIEPSPWRAPVQFDPPMPDQMKKPASGG